MMMILLTNQLLPGYRANVDFTHWPTAMSTSSSVFSLVFILIIFRKGNQHQLFLIVWVNDMINCG